MQKVSKQVILSLTYDGILPKKDDSKLLKFGCKGYYKPGKGYFIGGYASDGSDIKNALKYYDDLGNI